MTVPKTTTLVLAAVAAVAAVVATALASGADEPFRQGTAGMPTREAAIDEVRAGKGRALPQAPGDTIYMGVWQGCRFHITTAQRTNYQTADGGVVGMVDPPRPLPPQEPGCTDREPTQGEIIAMRAEVDGLSARHRPAGLPEPPPHPPPR